jgi:hypothetical protein
MKALTLPAAEKRIRALILRKFGDRAPPPEHVTRLANDLIKREAPK